MKILLLSLALLLPSGARAALAFSGVAAEMVTSPVNPFGATSNMAITVSMWAKITGNHQNANGDLFTRVNGGLGWTWSLGDTDYLILYAYGSPATYRYSATAAFTRNVWNHFVLTWDGKSSQTAIRYYVNNVETGYGSGASGGLPLIQPTSTGWTVGNRPGAGACVNGVLAEVAVWTNILSAAEITMLYSRRVVGTPLMVRKGNLAGYWPLNNGPDGVSTNYNNASEWSGRGDHGVISSWPVWRGSIFPYP